MKLREIREARGLSQIAVSQTTGLSQSGICRIERGEYNPTLSTIQEIARALDCTVGELLGETPYKPNKRRAGRPS
jgi:Predicted transcriptional regulator with C-terminal CBS domains